MTDFEGRVALVTGASKGMGRAAALAFGRRGAKVVAAVRRPQDGEEVVEEIRRAGGEARFVRADVTHSSDVEALVTSTVDAFGQLDIAFNNAGTEGVGGGPIEAEREEDFDTVMATNARGVWLCMKYEIRAMVGRGGGTIVNNASTLGFAGRPGASAYSASKHAVLGMTRAVALEYARKGVRINAVAPGNIETAMLERVLAGDSAQLAAMNESTPQGRTGKATEVINAVLFLASESSSYITGQAVTVDGGLMAKVP